MYVMLEVKGILKESIKNLKKFIELTLHHPLGGSHG